MLDILLLRKDLDAAVARLETRKSPQVFLNVEKFRALETERKTLQTRTEELQSQRNSLSKQIGMLKAKGQSTDQVMADVASIKTELDASALRLDALQAEIQDMLLAVPNLPHESVPLGADEHGNVEVRKWSVDGKAPKPLTLKCVTMSTLERSWAWTLTLASSYLALVSPSCVVKLPHAPRLGTVHVGHANTAARLYKCYHPLHRQCSTLRGTGQLPKLKAICLLPKRAGKNLKRAQTAKRFT